MIAGLIDDLSLTLKKLLDDAALGVNVSFVRPDDQFQPIQAGGTINLFLYDVRENVELRNNQPTTRLLGNGRIEIEKPPRRFDCSYLVTAWPDTTTPPPPDVREHQILGKALSVFGGMSTIPPGSLQGSLKMPEQDPIVPLTAPHTGLLQSVGEFWSAMNNRIRASFTVTATISVPVFPRQGEDMVTSIFGGFDPGPGLFDETTLHVGGRVLNQIGGPISGADVAVLDPQRNAQTDAAGQFTFASLPPGDREFRVVAVGFQPLVQTVAAPGPAAGIEFTLAPLP
jgi:hypothetical protein